jgi:hypothetical protein
MMTLNNQMSLVRTYPFSRETFPSTMLTKKFVTTINSHAYFIPSWPTIASFLIARSRCICRIVHATHSFDMGKIKTFASAILLLALFPTEKPLETPWT